MNFQVNTNLGNWLKQLNGKTVEKIYQVDFNKERHEDTYLPWLFLITFLNFDEFLEIEGAFDGDHIRIKLNEISELDQKINENNLSDEPNLWKVYDTQLDEILGRLSGQKIKFVEFGIDKDEFEINGVISKGQKYLFTFIRLNFETGCLTIFEGSSTGLGVSDDKNIELNFEETFERYDTK